MEAVFALINSALDSAMASAAIVAVVLEFAFRLVKTQKPLSWLHLGAKAVRGLGVAMGKLADLADRVLPQATAAPKE